eukprot:gb/GECG01002215.1/.p1 GENE.gb/GECG01002215.1/~~gb/GECG01002215.1/.p1  ORF type:complete len:775 (+),score=65.58 gb/GECG01002215.1/:1-2325(+)
MMWTKSAQLPVVLFLWVFLGELGIHAVGSETIRVSSRNQVKEVLGISENVRSQADLRARHPDTADAIIKLLRDSKESLDSFLVSARTDKWAFLGRLLAELNHEEEPGRQVWLKEIHRIDCVCPKYGAYSAFRDMVDCDGENWVRDRENTLNAFFRLEAEKEVMCHNADLNPLLNDIRNLKTDAECSVDISVESLWEGRSRRKLTVRSPSQLLNIPLGRLRNAAHSALQSVPLRVVAQQRNRIPGNFVRPRHLSSSELSFESLNNGSDSLSELFRLGKQTRCSRDEFGICKPGTVDLGGEVPFQSSLQLQRALESHLPLNYAHFFHTHNSFNAIGDVWYTEIAFFGWFHEFVKNITGGENATSPVQFVWTQQLYSVTDQLNFGVRGMMFDPWYVFGDLRVCHAGTQIQIMDDLIKLLEEVFHFKTNFTSYDLGCTPFDKLLAPALQEVEDWIEKPSELHVGQVTTVLLNVEGSHASCGHIGDIQNITESVFGQHAYTPLDRNRDETWPSRASMISKGKPLMIRATGGVGNDYIFDDMTVPGWPHDVMGCFTDYPACGGYNPGEWAIFGGTISVSVQCIAARTGNICLWFAGESQNLPPFFYGPKQYGLVNTENMMALQACGVSVSSMDLASPALIRAGVWTWDSETLSREDIAGVNNQLISYVLDFASSSRIHVAGNGSCVTIRARSTGFSGDASYGRWSLKPCNASLEVACWRPSSAANTDPLNQTVGSWELNPTSCLEGTFFVPPVSGHQNRKLSEVMIARNVSTAWLGFPPL